jgi:hypothetical protein
MTSLSISSQTTFLIASLIQFSLCITSDYITNNVLTNQKEVSYIKILVDNCTHGLNAAFCWITVLSLISISDKKRERNIDVKGNSSNEKGNIIIGSNVSSTIIGFKEFDNILEIFSALIIGCLLDLDHFIAAYSISLTAATNLQRRPFGHNLFFMVIVSLILFLGTTRRFGLLFCTSIFTHLSRDAVKRGFDLSPFSTIATPKIYYSIYVMDLFLLPILVSDHLIRYPHFWKLKSSCFSRREQFFTSFLPRFRQTLYSSEIV